MAPQSNVFLPAIFNQIQKAAHDPEASFVGNPPGIAKGQGFVSLEDEAGIANAIVRKELYEEIRLNESLAEWFRPVSLSRLKLL